jgi:hypothetical protein
MSRLLCRYPDGMTVPMPSKVDFRPGELLGCVMRCASDFNAPRILVLCLERTARLRCLCRCVSGELGLRKFLESRGHTFVVTTDKDGCVRLPTRVFVFHVNPCDVAAAPDASWKSSWWTRTS